MYRHYYEEELGPHTLTVVTEDKEFVRFVLSCGNKGLYMTLPRSEILEIVIQLLKWLARR